jgi:alanine racemase
LAYIELSKANYFSNLDSLCQKLGSTEKLAVVLKDNAYGHGILPMASLAKEYGIKRAIVRYTFEAKLIEEYFEDILVLSETSDFKSKFSYTINSLEHIPYMPPISVHLKIDSGMHRNGIAYEELEDAYKLIAKHKLKLDGMMTHFRSADELSSQLFWLQQNWKKIKEKVATLTKTYNFKTPLFHSANSAATLRLEKYDDDFARCGIATFGYSHIPKVFNIQTLKPVLTLWGEKIATRVLKQGERIGYGGEYTATSDMVVSTYDIGYGDGFFRFVNEAKFLGRVSMDSSVLKGDKQKVAMIGDAKEIAQLKGTISYDTLVKLSPTIKRVITD